MYASRLRHEHSPQYLSSIPNTPWSSPLIASDDDATAPSEPAQSRPLCAVKQEFPVDVYLDSTLRNRTPKAVPVVVGFRGCGSSV